LIPRDPGLSSPVYGSYVTPIAFAYTKVRDKRETIGNKIKRPAYSIAFAYTKVRDKRETIGNKIKRPAY
jgi:hypothetical protein